MQKIIGKFAENVKEHLVDSVQEKLMKMLIKYFLSVVFFLFGISVYAKETYLSELVLDSSISFQHWDVKKSEVSGYSHFRYEQITTNGRHFIIEKNKNTKPDGKVFTKKELWFDASSGLPLRYEEEDFRKNFRIVNTYSGRIIKTILYKSGKTLEFETDIGLENTVPLEIFFFFLRKNFQRILISKEFSFTLFLPLLAMELEEKGLPRSMSLVQMIVELKEDTIIETSLGSLEAKKFLIVPQSRLLRALLPREKTNFEFIIAKERPHHILQFKLGTTKHILQEINMPE